MMHLSIESLVQYFEEELVFKPSDLVMSEEDRNYKLGQIEMLDEIKVLMKEGFPDATK